MCSFIFFSGYYRPTINEKIMDPLTSKWSFGICGVHWDVFLEVSKFDTDHFSTKTWINTSSTAQGGGGSFKNRKPIGEVGCCESGMAKRIHWWTERCLRSPLCLSLSLTIYLPIYLSSVYLSLSLAIYLSLSLFHLVTYLPIYLSTYLSI